MTKNIQLTQEGIDELKAELLELQGRRKTVAEKLHDAVEQGDLSENSDYTAAREEQTFVESRIAEIEDIVASAKVIVHPVDHQSVELGASVTLKHDGGEVEYAIVGSYESDPMENKISNESPIGEALMGKKIGETVEVAVPSGTISYEVVKIA